MIDLHNRCIRVSDINICKFCFSGDIIKNGTTKTKKQQYFCKTCQKRFLDYYSYQAYRKGINAQIIQLTKEGLGIRSIARILDISVNTVLNRILKIAEHINPPVLRYHQCYELDELRFFIRKKNNPVWLVYAIEKSSKRVASFYIGKRNNRSLNAVIKTLINAKAETIYTDKLNNYQYLIPEEMHSVKRYATNHIERQNLSIRTHLKRFSRKTICYPKSTKITTAILKIYFWL